MAIYNQAKKDGIKGTDLLILSFFALAISTSFHFSSNPYLSFSNKNPQNRLINLTIPFFLFILVPITFIHGMVLLIFRFTIPPDSPRGRICSIQFDRLAKATLGVTLLCLLTGGAIEFLIIFGASDSV